MNIVRLVLVLLVSPLLAACPSVTYMEGYNNSAGPLVVVGAYGDTEWKTAKVLKSKDQGVPVLRWIKLGDGYPYPHLILKKNDQELCYMLMGKIPNPYWKRHFNNTATFFAQVEPDNTIIITRPNSDFPISSTALPPGAPIKPVEYSCLEICDFESCSGMR